MRNVVRGSLILLSLVVLSLGILLWMRMPERETSSLPPELVSKALTVTREYLAGKYESVYEQISEVSMHRVNKMTAIRATATYRAKGKWVSRMQPTDVYSVRIVRYSPNAKAFLVCMSMISHPEVSALKHYLRNREQTKIPTEILSRYLLLEVVVGDTDFVQI